ncbi:nucleoside triphosphate pyrophosphatase [Aestuariibius sp. HNIBRBA575]|uniref:Maf family protein n=1 Tax=Aestuariibius sp. HNIBRBA575 TaxID=3233343 RepID=UPI0034A30A1C
MNNHIILASNSQIRATLLRNAGVSFDVLAKKIDEESIRASLQAEEASPRDIADALAEMKAARAAEAHPNSFVLGCDQILAFQQNCFAKPADKNDARQQLQQLRGKQHQLLSAAVLYHENKPIWRHVGQVRLTMRPFSDAYLDDYLDRNWDSIRHAVGCYKLEEEGVRLFSRVEGDYFNVLGLPLLEFLSYLTLRGILPK